MVDTHIPTVSAWQSFTRAKSKICRCAHLELREHGLSRAQYDILNIINESGKPGVKLNDLSQRLWVTSGNVTGLVDRLEEAGLIARVSHPEDRRVTLAVLTQKGHDLYAHINPIYFERIQSLMSALSPNEQATLTGLLNRLADQADKLST
jgi:DNA-binding MarR family transcriptional regulator